MFLKLAPALLKLTFEEHLGPWHRPHLYPKGGKVVEPSVVVDNNGEVITTFLPDMIKVGLMTVEKAMLIGQLVYLVTRVVPQAKQRAGIPHEGILCNTGFCWQRHFDVTNWFKGAGEAREVVEAFGELFWGSVKDCVPAMAVECLQQAFNGKAHFSYIGSNSPPAPEARPDPYEKPPQKPTPRQCPRSTRSQDAALKCTKAFVAACAAKRTAEAQSGQQTSTVAPWTLCGASRGYRTITHVDPGEPKSCTIGFFHTGNLKNLATGEFRVEGRKKTGKREGWGLHMDLSSSLGGVCILNGSQVYHGTSGSARRLGMSHRVGIVGVGNNSTVRSAERDVAAV
ncbi:g5811 [Coccomyxa elongata]